MKHFLIIIVLLSTIVLIGAGCSNSEEAFQECKTQCKAEISLKSTGLGLSLGTDSSARDACIQMCIEKYK